MGWNAPWSGLITGYFEPIYAVGNGVVVVTQGGCDTYSSFGCNSGLGNHLSMIFESNGKVYGALIMHMANGSFKVGPGSVVSQGQQVGGVGNSGNSIGSHAHIEIFDLGVGSVSKECQCGIAHGVLLNLVWVVLTVVKAVVVNIKDQHRAVLTRSILRCLKKGVSVNKLVQRYTFYYGINNCY
ncbi:M23 family metallopeptidase [Erysipelothrix sp. D19-032]